MKRTVEEFKKQAKEKNIVRWNIHICSICGYDCGYIIDGDNVLYDSGCYCSHQSPHQSSWEELIAHYNNNQRENNQNIKQEYLDKMDKFWGFIN